MSYLDTLKQLTAWDVEPTLTELELEDILTTAALEDAAAVAQAWLIKAARAAATVDEPTAGTVTSKIFDNCRSMARIYAGKRTMTLGQSV